MAYRDITNINDYNQVIYSGDAKHRIKILFNDVELQDAGLHCEKLTVNSRILDDSKQRFSLDNFMSKQCELILHNVDLSTIQDQVEISIGTLVNNSYEYVPIGIFNIQDKPKTDKNKITIQLRDNAVKFDIPYNAEKIINANSGSATKRQILEDICTTCGVTHNIESFLGENDPVGVFDNQITARVYISYLAEQAGKIATINRSGELEFIDISDLTTIQIPLRVVEKYENGETYTITKVEYEDAIRKFEHIGDENGDYLYINTANPYISTQEQIDDIYELVNGFSINSFKTGKVIGNPTIDPYDIIEIVDGANTYRTLANNKMTYNGVLIQEFDTKVSLEDRNTNITVKSPASRFKRAFTEIDNVNAEIRMVTEQTETIQSDLRENYYDKTKTTELIQNAETGVTNTFSEAGGNNIFRNTGLWFANSGNDSNVNPYEYWSGIAVRSENIKASNRAIINLQNGTFSQSQPVASGNYTVSFKYKKLNELANVKVAINSVETVLDSLEDAEIVKTGYVGANNNIEIKFISDTNNACEIYDLMVNAGSVKLAYSQNQNETTTDTVNISKGITITSSDSKVKFVANSDGIRLYNEQSSNTDPTTEYTATGTNTNTLNVKNEATILEVKWQKVGSQTWLTRL